MTMKSVSQTSPHCNAETLMHNGSLIFSTPHQTLDEDLSLWLMQVCQLCLHYPELLRTLLDTPRFAKRYIKQCQRALVRGDM